jgi:DNA-directed RNA polymerase subunit K/omega
MDYKKSKADLTAVTRKVRDFDKETGNIYETVAIISKRANQIAVEMKEELNQKIQEFATTQDNLEEIFENREQIEVAKFYEKLPKPTLIAVHEFSKGKVYYRNPVKKTVNEF